MPPQDRLRIGQVLRAHGVRGGLRARASEAIAELKRVFVNGREMAIRHVLRERGDWLVELEGVEDRDAADALRGQPIEAVRAELPALANDELYVADLIGCRVVDAGGRELGEIVETFPAGPNEVLVVRGAREFMLPLVDGIVTNVDLAARVLTCDPPPGLIDLDEAEPA